MSFERVRISIWCEKLILTKSSQVNSVLTGCPISCAVDARQYPIRPTLLDELKPYPFPTNGFPIRPTLLDELKTSSIPHRMSASVSTPIQKSRADRQLPLKELWYGRQCFSTPTADAGIFRHEFPHSKIQRESFFVDRSRTSIPAAFDGMFDYLYCLCILCIIRWDNLLFHIHTFLCRKGTKNTGYTGQNANIL